MKQVLLLTVNKYATVQNVTIATLRLVFVHPCSWVGVCVCVGTFVHAHAHSSLIIRILQSDIVLISMSVQ